MGGHFEDMLYTWEAAEALHPIAGTIAMLLVLGTGAAMFAMGYRLGRRPRNL